MGSRVMLGRKCTVSVTALVVTEPAEFVNTASYLYRFFFAEAVKLYVADFAPAMSVHFFPFEESLHCTEGFGEPLTLALKSAFAPALTVRFDD